MTHRFVLKKLLTNVLPHYGSSVGVLQCKNIKLTTYNHVRYINASFIPPSKGIIPHQAVDLLLQNIRSASDTCDILYNVQQHSKIMNEVHVTQALQSIFLLQKSQQSSITNGELVKDHSFHLLCNVLQQKVRFIELHDHLNALKVMSYVGVPSDNKIVQILLQLVVKQVNSLSLQQIVFLDFLLKEFQSCPLVDALKIALPVVFEANFRMIKDLSDMKQITDYFVYAVRKRLSHKCIDAFVDLLSENNKDIDVNASKVIVRTLSEAKRIEPSFGLLLRQCLDNVVDNIDNYTAVDFNYILGRLVTNYNRRQLSYFYHEEFVDSCANYVVDKQIDHESASWILKSCNRFRHMNKGLLDYISNIVAENPSSLNKWHDGMLVTLLNGLSLADYKPDNFDTYKDELVANIIKLTNRPKLPWLRITLDLCTLNCWSHYLFDFAFEEEFLNNFLGRDNFEDAFELLHLYQAVVLLNPTYKGNLPPEALMEKVKNKIKQYDPINPSPILGALTHGVGGSSYVLSNLYTRMGHYIDHVVVMRKGGYFVSINKQEQLVKYVEDIVVPDDGQIILLQYQTPFCYTLNTEKVLGQVRLNINTLEAMGYHVVPVVESTWNNLMDNEKIPYLMQALNNKCQTQDSVEASRS